jgi:hypothetical protein
MDRDRAKPDTHEISLTVDLLAWDWASIVDNRYVEVQ